MAARVQPPLFKRELVDMFMSTLQGPYLVQMVGSASSRFSDLMVTGERIENFLKSGRIQSVSIATTNRGKKPYAGFPKKKEGCLTTRLPK